MDGSELIGISRIAIPSGKISLLSQTPILRCSTSLDLLTRVLNYGRLRAHRDIADRDSKRQDFFALEPRFSDARLLWISDTRPQLWMALILSWLRHSRLGASNFWTPTPRTSELTRSLDLCHLSSSDGRL
jgi:hypothetical protein